MKIPSILKGKDVPKHLAISATRIIEWAEKKGKTHSEALEKNIEKINYLMDFQIKKDIPVVTVQVSTRSQEEIYSMKNFIKSLLNKELIKENKIRIYVIGDWYNLDSELTDEIRTLIDATKEYDNYFFNICLNYDGQKEILTAIKLLIKKSEAEKISIDELKLEDIKENLATSYFIPPELIIENGGRYSGLLLWDSKGSTMYFTNKYWLDFEKSDFDVAINFYNQNKKIN